MEFMILLGFIMIVSIPMIVIYQGYSADTQYQLTQNQVKKIANKIVDNAESVYFLGPPSMTTIRVSFPYNVKRININDSEISIALYYKGTSNEIVVPSSVNLTGSLNTTGGVKKITIRSMGNLVRISG